MLGLSRRTDQKESQRIARHESFEQRLIHARQILAHFLQRVLRRNARLHRAIVGGQIQVHKHGLLFALRQHSCEIHRRAWWFPAPPLVPENV
jgi:hypothetical protein